MNEKLFVIMGVSGTGKSTIGRLLATALEIPFFDGDDYHPEANITKMSEGVPLTDTDRQAWLIRLNKLAQEHRHQGIILACSALKKQYRQVLQKGLQKELQFIHLAGSFNLVKERMKNRKDHFMPLDLLQSQFDTLEEPSNAISVSIELSPEQLVAEILKQA